MSRNHHRRFSRDHRERRPGAAYAAWDDFAARDPGLFRKWLLEEFYQPAVLNSSVARAIFILPR